MGGGSLPGPDRGHWPWRRPWKQVSWYPVFWLPRSLHVSSCWSCYIADSIILLLLFLAPLLGNLIPGFVLLILIYSLVPNCLRSFRGRSFGYMVSGALIRYFVILGGKCFEQAGVARPTFWKRLRQDIRTDAFLLYPECTWQATYEAGRGHGRLWGQHRTLLWPLWWLFMAHSWFCKNVLLAPNVMFVCHDRFPLPIQLSKVSLVLLTSASQGSTYFRTTPASLQMSCGCQSGPDYRNGWNPKPFPHKEFILANSWWEQVYEIYNK